MNESYEGFINLIEEIKNSSHSLLEIIDFFWGYIKKYSGFWSRGKRKSWFKKQNNFWKRRIEKRIFWKAGKNS